MTDNEQRLIEALNYINPDEYDTWLKVGMALKHEGFPLSVWGDWSRQSNKYKEGDCAVKWRSFNETNGGQPVTGGTLLQLAKQNGYTPTGRGNTAPRAWRPPTAPTPQTPQRTAPTDVETLPADYKPEKIPNFPDDYDPTTDMREYLSILFRKDEHIGYCDRLTKQTDNDGKLRFVPMQSVKNRTAGELIEALKSGIENAGICAQSEGGAFVRFNPMDGSGEGDANVTDYRFCLIESDTDTIEKQYGLYKALRLPIAVLVHSGNKSLHAITHVDAKDLDEYRERVRYIYDYCKKHGLHVDEQSKNASRYSRLPGIKRGAKWQYIIDKNIGAKDFLTWAAWVKSEAEAEADPLSEIKKRDVELLDFPPLSLERSRALREKLGNGRDLDIPFWVPEYAAKPRGNEYVSGSDWIKYLRFADTVRFDGMNIIGARTGGGKTTLMISLAAWILHRDPSSQAVFIALEESEEIITEKIVTAYLYFEDTKKQNCNIGKSDGYGRTPDPRDYEITYEQVVAFCSGNTLGLDKSQREHIAEAFERLSKRLIIVDPPKLDEARDALIASKRLTDEQRENAKELLSSMLTLDQSVVLKAIIQKYRMDKADTVFFIDYAQLIHNEKAEATRTGSNVLELKAAMRDLMREAAAGALIFLAAQMNRTGAQAFNDDPSSEFNYAIPENLGESSGIERNAFKVIYCTIYRHRDTDGDKRDYLNVSIIKNRGGVQRVALGAPISWNAKTVNLYACTWPKFTEDMNRAKINYTNEGEPIYGNKTARKEQTPEAEVQQEPTNVIRSEDGATFNTVDDTEELWRGPRFTNPDEHPKLSYLIDDE